MAKSKSDIYRQVSLRLTENEYNMLESIRHDLGEKTLSRTILNVLSEYETLKARVDYLNKVIALAVDKQSLDRANQAILDHIDYVNHRANSNYPPMQDVL